MVYTRKDDLETGGDAVLPPEASAAMLLDKSSKTTLQEFPSIHIRFMEGRDSGVWRNT